MKNEVSIDDKPLVLSVALADLPRGLMKDIKSRGAEGKVKGVFDPNTGEVWLIRQNIRNSASVPETILHELVGHKGLRIVFGDKYDKLLDNIYGQMDKADIVRIKANYTFEAKDGSKLPDNYTLSKDGKQYIPDARAIADEYLAQKAEENNRPTYIQQAIAEVRDMIRRFFGLNYSDNDIKNLFEHSRKALKTQQGTGYIGNKEESLRFSIKDEEDKKDKENKDEEDQYEKHGITPFMADMFKKSLADMLKPKNREAYSEVSDYIEGKAAEKGIGVTPVASTADLPEDLKKTKEAAVTDPKVGKLSLTKLLEKKPNVIWKECSKQLGGRGNAYKFISHLISEKEKEKASLESSLDKETNKNKVEDLYNQIYDVVSMTQKLKDTLNTKEKPTPKKIDFFKVLLLILLAWIAYSLYDSSLSYRKIAEYSRYKHSGRLIIDSKTGNAYRYQAGGKPIFLFKGMDKK